MVCIKNFGKLYKKNKMGKIQEWNIWVEENGNDFVIKTSHGVLGGKIVEDKGKVIKCGKNIGRSNETSAKEQALFEAESTYKGKLDENYYSDLGEAKEAKEVTPMLAYDLKKQSGITFPKICQRKYDGVRCVARKEGGKITLKSRNGKEFSGMDHIRKGLENLPEDIVLDGELYTDKMDFQTIVGLVKREKNIQDKEKEIKLHSFDIIDLNKPDMKFLDRYNKLLELVKTLGLKEIVVTENVMINNMEELNKLREKYIGQGYEGVMLREDMPYVMNRTKYLLKYKMTMDREYKIIGFREATGNDEKTVIWKCETDEGKEFEVRPKGEREYREKLLLEADKYIGKNLTVRFQELTNDKLPRFPVGIAIRDYEEN